MTDPLLGSFIGERFRLTSRIGEGGMGVVYLAEDKAASGQAAVKFLHRHLLGNADFVARFRQEAKTAGRFRHESAVRILDSGETPAGLPYIAMEYCPGRSLQAILRDEGALGVGRSCAIAEQILRALSAAHAGGIIHRDLKPENIRIEAEAGGGERVKVLDFGVAKFIGTEDMEEMTGAVKTKTGVVFGTPKYMAPEQILGEPVDGRSDIYSVGAILYEMLTGAPPFPAEDIIGFVAKHLKEPVEPPTERAPEMNIPPALETVVLEMLDKNRVARPARASEVAERLTKFAGDAPAAVRADRGPSRLRAVVYLLGGAAGAAGAFSLAPDVRVEGAAAAAGLGLGAALAFGRFPRVGEGAFWLRTAVVALVLAAAVGASFELGGDSYLTLCFGLGGLLTFVLYSIGWGRRARIAAFLLAAVAAPLIAAPTIPFPAEQGYERLWERPILDLENLAPLLALAAVSAGFALGALFAPSARAAGPAGGAGKKA